MQAITWTVPGRRARMIALAAGLALAALAASLGSPSSAFACENPRNANDIIQCYTPWEGSYTFNVPLSAAAQSATHIPGDGSATGTASLTLSPSANQVCASTSWQGTSSPVVMAHIHGGGYGLPEDPAVTIPIMGIYPNGAPNPVNGYCVIAPGPEISAIVRCPAQFNVVVHSQKHPWAAIRGQLGTTCNL